MNLRSFEEAFRTEFSGLRTMQLISRLTEYDRDAASPGIEGAFDFAFSEATAAGLAHVELLTYDVDGKSKWWTWTKPWYWHVKKASLALVSPKQEYLVRFEDTPCVVASFSGSTPSDGITTEIVDVGPGIEDRDYGEKSLPGRIVLISGTSDLALQLACTLARERGAIGYITDSIVEQPPLMTRIDISDSVGFSSIPDNDERSHFFGFNISHRQMTMLKHLLAVHNHVVVHARVDAFLGPGRMHVLTGVIEGTSRRDEEVLLISHICHRAPSANDNASGSALLLEVARTYNELIDKGRISPPSRTLRFMWVPETYGALAYLHANPEWAERLLAAICCDMVGENQKLCGGPLVVEKSPDTTPSFLNALAAHFLDRIPVGGQMYCGDTTGLWKYQMVSFGGGSDNYPFVAAPWRVPTIYFGHWPDKFHHSSFDTPDKVDPTELEKVGIVVAEMIRVIADAEPSDGMALAWITAENGLRQLAKRATDLLLRLHEVPARQELSHSREIENIVREGIRMLEFNRETEIEALNSVCRLARHVNGFGELAAEVALLQEEVRRTTLQLAELLLRNGEYLAGKQFAETDLIRDELTEKEIEAQSLVPTKKWLGPLNITSFTGDLSRESTKWLWDLLMEVPPTIAAYLRNASLWVDGERDLLQISKCVKYSNPSVPGDLAVLTHFFMDLNSVGLVTFRGRGSM